MPLPLRPPHPHLPRPQPPLAERGPRMPRFFIDRPIFAWVIALFILVFGVVAITQLPISQYPNVAPPAVVISATYPGASARTLDDAVVSVIEQELNGAPGLAYMESVSQANGTAQITVTFETGTNIDLAQVFGTERAMRIWVDPAKLVSFGLSVADVNSAIRAQNALVPAGGIGDRPNLIDQTM